MVSCVLPSSGTKESGERDRERTCLETRWNESIVVAEKRRASFGGNDLDTGNSRSVA